MLAGGPADPVDGALDFVPAGAKAFLMAFNMVPMVWNAAGIYMTWLTRLKDETRGGKT